MKIYSKSESIERKNSDACLVTEYPIDDEALDFAIVQITGKYPDKKFAINNVCKEIVYVHEGNGKVTVNGPEHLIEKVMLY